MSSLSEICLPQSRVNELCIQAFYSVGRAVPVYCATLRKNKSKEIHFTPRTLENQKSFIF